MMNCTISKPQFANSVGLLSSVSIALIFSGIFFIPVVFAHILLFSFFNVSFESSVALAVYISTVLFTIIFPMYFYFGIKRSYQDINYHFCDEGFYINDVKFEYKNIEDVEVTSSLAQNFCKVTTLKITTNNGDKVKHLYFRNIKEPQILLSRIACPME